MLLLARAPSQWQQRPGGQHWDTVKPLARHGHCVSRTLLVDNELRKAMTHEERNMVVLPTWDTAAGAWKP